MYQPYGKTPKNSCIYVFSLLDFYVSVKTCSIGQNQNILHFSHTLRLIVLHGFFVCALFFYVLYIVRYNCFVKAAPYSYIHKKNCQQ